MLKIGWSTIHRIFVASIVSMEAVLLCLNLKHGHGLLACSMPEVFNKTGHGLSDITIAWAEFKPVFNPGYFVQNRTYIYWVLEWNWRSFVVGESTKNPFRVSSLAWKCTSQLVYHLFTNLLDSIIECLYQINVTNLPLGTTPSYSNLATMILVYWLYQNTYTGKLLVGISPVEMELTFIEIYPETMSVSNITEKNQTWLAGLRKT